MSDLSDPSQQSEPNPTTLLPTPEVAAAAKAARRSLRQASRACDSAAAMAALATLLDLGYPFPHVKTVDTPTPADEVRTGGVEEDSEEDAEEEDEGSAEEDSDSAGGGVVHEVNPDLPTKALLRDPMDLLPDYQAAPPPKGENENEEDKEELGVVEEVEDDEEDVGDAEQWQREETEFHRLRRHLLEETPEAVVDSLPLAQRYLRILFGSARRSHDVTLFGRDFTHLYHSVGVRLHYRTLLESKHDAVASAVAARLPKLLALYHTFKAEAAPPQQQQRMVILDLFCGTGNSLYWLQQTFQPLCSSCQCIGFELNRNIYAQTKRNLELLGVAAAATTASMPLEVWNVDYAVGMRRVAASRRVPENALILCLLDPPWGDALAPTTHSGASEMDLKKTSPPTPEILLNIVKTFPREVLAHRVAVVVHLFYKRRNARSFGDVLRHFHCCCHEFVPQSPTQGFIFGIL